MTGRIERIGLADDIDVMDSLVDVAGLRVVDAGCGAGALARLLVERGARVVAIEPEPGQAAVNRRELAGDAIEFHETGAEALPCADESVDGVFFSKSLHHVPESLMARALREAMRVLRPGRRGFLYVLEPEAGGAHTELMAPFHDESEEREAARRTVAEVAAPAFDEAREIRFRNRRRYVDYAAFLDRVSGLDYNSFTREDVDVPIVRARFEAGETTDGYLFDQPMRVHLFRGKRRVS